MYVCSKFVIIVYKLLVVHIRFSALGCHLKWGPRGPLKGGLVEGALPLLPGFQVSNSLLFNFPTGPLNDLEVHFPLYMVTS